MYGNTGKAMNYYLIIQRGGVVLITNYKSFVPMVMGPGAASRTGVEARALGITKALFVYDKQLPSKCTDVIESSLNSEGIEYVIFTDVLPDAPDFIVEKGYEFAAAQGGIDGIICLGGGSAMDTAKGINVLMANPGPISRYYSANNPNAGFYGAAKNPGLPLILIPSTAGTGSEQGKSAVIHDSTTGRKSPVLSTICCLASLAIIDPEMTLSCPARLTAITGLDAFTHAYEAYTGDDEQLVNDVSPLSDMEAEYAMREIVEYLPKVLKDGGNIEWRYHMSLASTVAMKSVANAHSHLGHCFAHAIGSTTNVPHGVCCWVCESHLAPWISDVHYKKNKWVAQVLGSTVPEDASADELSIILHKAMVDFGAAVGVPHLKDYGATREQVMASIDLMQDDYLFYSGKKRISVDQAKEILKLICDSENL